MKKSPRSISSFALLGLIGSQAVLPQLAGANEGPQVSLKRLDQNQLEVRWRPDSLLPEGNPALVPPYRLEVSYDLLAWVTTGLASSQQLSGLRADATLEVGLDEHGRQAFFRVVPETLDLRGANLSDRDLSDLCLEGVDLSGANLSGANLDGAKFLNCDLSDVNARGASFNRTTFSRSTLDDANFSGVEAADADFAKTEGRGVDFSDANLYQARFKDAKLPESNFSRSNLIESNFGDADINASRFVESDLRKADLDEGTNADAADFTGALLELAVLTQSSFSEALFVDADLTNGDLRLGDFTNANFEGANMTLTQVRGADFTGATGNIRMHDVILPLDYGVSVLIYGRTNDGSVHWGLGF